MRAPVALDIDLLSDATFGRGEGTAGLVDVEVEHDRLGLPFLGGKTLRGLLHDSWLTMRGHFGLDEAARRVIGPGGDLEETGILVIGDAVVAAETRAWIEAAVRRDQDGLDFAAVLGALTDVRLQTSQERATGAPARTTLRSSRVVSRGLTLSAPLRWIALPSADDLRVLELCAKGCRHAGLARNRGRGHIRVSLREGDPGPKADAAPVPVPLAGGGAWYVPITLTLEAPAVVTTLAGEPNSAETLAYLPGSALRGAVAAGIARTSADEAGRTAAIRKVILSGRVRFLNAYPSPTGRRSLPTPRSWRLQGPEQRHVDLANLDTADWPSEKLVRPPHPFCVLDARPRWAPVEQGARVHQQRDRQVGRAWTDRADPERPIERGAIYHYHYLEAGQSFTGLVAIDASIAGEAGSMLALIRRAVGDTIAVGRSRRGGYGGQARVAWGDPRPREGEGTRSVEIACGGRAFALLTSDYIGRDPRSGQLDPTHLEAELVGRLPGMRVPRAFWELGIVGGYNRMWGLPLPQAPCLRAGSLLVLQAEETVSSSDVAALEHSGLGERRSEGFGRILLLPTDAWVEGPREPTPRAAKAPSGAPPALATLIQTRILEHDLDTAIDRWALRLVASAKGGSLPSRSLLGRLRGLMHHPHPRLEDLRGWLDGAEDERLPRPALEQLGRCRLRLDGRERRLRDVLLTMLPGPQELDLTKVLDWSRTAERRHVVSVESAVEFLREPTRDRAARARLIERTLANLARRSRLTDGAVAE